MANGTDFTDRIGRRINVVSVQVRGYYIPDYTTPPCQPQMARLMIIEDLQTNGVIATPADILQAVTVSSFMNLNNRDRFRVLREEIMTLGAFNNVATQSYAAGNQIVPINIYAKCNIPVCFGEPPMQLVPSPPAPSTSFSSGMSLQAQTMESHNFPAVCDSSTHDSAVPVNNNFYN